MKRILVLALVLGASLTTSFAQTKLGHMNFQEVMLALPERADAEKELEAFAQEYKVQLDEMRSDYETKYLKLQQEAESLTQTILEYRAQELQQLEQGIMTLENQANQDLQTKEVELLNPMIEKVQTAVKAVAKANGYTYVLDSSSGILLYEGGTDVSDLVRKELGLPAAAAAE